MNDFKKKNRFRKKLYSKPVLILLCILLLFLVKGVWDVRTKAKIGEEKMIQSKTELDGLNIKKEDSERQLERVRSPLGREEELRQKYNVAKPDETIVVIVEPDEPDEPVENEPESDGFWSKLLFWKN